VTEPQGHEALVLRAIRLAARREPRGVTTTGAAERAYHELCLQEGETPRRHTMFWTYMKRLAAAGHISTQRAGHGSSGLTTEIRPLGDAEQGVA
jgi:Cdc6-like AAA superfamily ATPase